MAAKFFKHRVNMIIVYQDSSQGNTVVLGLFNTKFLSYTKLTEYQTNSRRPLISLEATFSKILPFLKS